jgi:hypothetical protein
MFSRDLIDKASLHLASDASVLAGWPLAAPDVPSNQASFKQASSHSISANQANHKQAKRRVKCLLVFKYGEREALLSLGQFPSNPLISPYVVTILQALVTERGSITVETSCKAYSMLYDVNISFPRGVRKIEHTLSNLRAIPKPTDLYDSDPPESVTSILDFLGSPPTHDPVIILNMSGGPQAVEEWRQTLRTAIPVTNKWALLDALGSVLEAESWVDTRLDDKAKYQPENEPGNSTSTKDCNYKEIETSLSDNNTASMSYISLSFWQPMLIILQHLCKEPCSTNIGSIT